MKIIETSVIDIHEGNVNERKLELANVIISTFRPLLDKLQVEKSEEEKNLTSLVEANSKKISNEKAELQTLLKTLEKEKKLKNTLEVLWKVDPVKLEYNRSLKNEMVVFLRILEKLSPEKISSYLQDILKVSK